MTDNARVVWVNDVDLRSLDFWSDPLVTEGWSRPEQVQTILGRSGGVIVTAESVLEARTFDLAGALICSSTAQLRQRFDALKALFSGTVELRTGAAEDRVVRVRAQRWSPEAPHLRGGRVTVSLLAPDPLWYDRVASLYVLPNGVAVPLEPGSAPSAVSLVILGGASVTDPHLSLKDATGSQVQDLYLTGSLAADEAWEIDAVECEITKVTLAGGQTRTNVPGILTDGDYLRLDPLYGTGDGAKLPTLTLTGATGMAIVRRAWL